MADERPVATPAAPEGDQTMALMAKMLVSIIVGPKLSPLLSSVGVPMDPVMLSVIVGGVLHKIHVLVKQETGWDWI